MTQRERVSAVGVLAVLIVAALGFVGYEFFWVPLEAQRSNLANLEAEGQKKRANIDSILARKALLVRWRQVSLPPDTDLAWREYERYLSELMRRSGFDPVSVKARPPDTRGVPTLPNKQPIYTRLVFVADGRAPLAAVVTMMERFYRTPLLHQIRQLVISRPLTASPDQAREQLEVKLTVEALVVAGAPPRKFLMPPAYVAAAARALATRPGNPGEAALALWAADPTGPLGSGPLARPQGSYDAIAAKDIFLGPRQAAPVEEKPLDFDYLRFTRLTDITDTGSRVQAFLFDVSSNRHTRLRTDTGFNRFALLSSPGGNALVHGVVKRIDKRDLIFRVEVAATEPEDNPRRRYRDKEAIYRLHRDEMEQLVKDKLAKPEDAPRLYRVSREYWDSLVDGKLVDMRSSSEFSFHSDLVRGRVVRKEPNYIVFRIDEKYCAYPGGDRGFRSRPKAHEGFCRMTVGDVLREALSRPLSDDEAKEFRLTRSAAAGDTQH
ncbi:MAG TPA: hypothetical protein VFA26_14420 [Gemmataceae bacterium]|nr:hypothetical protein [Gemmataceae bacterium]